MKTIIYNKMVLFEKRSVLSLKNLLKKYGVRGNSYAGEVLKRIYQYYFGDAVDMFKEYKKYYKN